MALQNLTVRAKPSDHQRLQNLVDANGTTKGEEMRRALAAHLNGVEIAAMLDAKNRAIDAKIQGLEERLIERFESHLKALANAFTTIHLVVNQNGEAIDGHRDALAPDAATRTG